MPDTPALPRHLARAVLDYLAVAPTAPDIALLDRLIEAYARRVPWESASRIARRAAVADTAACPRWPEAFWESALAHGTGGTCFESNYAFFSLLRALGFPGYLTINDMGQTRGCHTAIVVQLDGARWLADAGFPVYAPLRLDVTAPQPGRLHSYSLLPQTPGRYLLERDRHPQPYCFTVVDEPVPDAAYRAATTADYGPGGLFLDRVIILKVIDGRIWRFGDDPPLVESFGDGRRTEHPITGDVAAALARRFGIDEDIVRRALASV